MAQHWVAARPGGLEVFDFVSYDVPPPASGEVTVEVRAAGVNPADASHVAEGRRGPFPRGVGYEIAGLTAIGPAHRAPRSLQESVGRSDGRPERRSGANGASLSWRPGC